MANQGMKQMNMIQAINSVLTGLNTIGQGFWDYAAGIFIQASVLIVLPFLDRSPHRNPADRWKILLPAAVIVIFILTLSIYWYNPNTNSNIKYFYTPYKLIIFYCLNNIGNCEDH